MAPSIMLAWGIPVDDADLAASIEAYASTKATITTLKFCIKYTAGAMGKLAPEVVSMIADAVLDLAAKPKITSWRKLQKCYKGECRLRDHFSSETLIGILEDVDWCMDVFDEALHDDASNVHEEWCENQDLRFGHSKSMFQKAKKFFEDNFQVKANFDLCKFREVDEWPHDTRKISAQLLVPISSGKVQMGNDADRMNFATESIVGHERLMKPTEKTRARLRDACTRLRVRPRTSEPMEDKPHDDGLDCRRSGAIDATNLSGNEQVELDPLFIQFQERRRRYLRSLNRNVGKIGSHQKSGVVKSSSKKKAAVMEGWPKLMLVGSGEEEIAFCEF